MLAQHLWIAVLIQESSVIPRSSIAFQPLCSTSETTDFTGLPSLLVSRTQFRGRRHVDTVPEVYSHGLPNCYAFPFPSGCRAWLRKLSINLDRNQYNSVHGCLKQPAQTGDNKAHKTGQAQVRL